MKLETYPLTEPAWCLRCQKVRRRYVHDVFGLYKRCTVCNHALSRLPLLGRPAGGDVARQ